MNTDIQHLEFVCVQKQLQTSSANAAITASFQTDFNSSQWHWLCSCMYLSRSVTVQKRCDHQSKGCSGQQGFTLDQESMQLQKTRRTSLATSGIFDTDAVQSLLLTDRIFLSHCVSKKITTTTYWPYDNKMKLTCHPCNHYIQRGKESSIKNRCWPLQEQCTFFFTF